MVHLRLLLPLLAAERGVGTVSLHHTLAFEQAVREHLSGCLLFSAFMGRRGLRRPRRMQKSAHRVGVISAARARVQPCVQLFASMLALFCIHACKSLHSPVLPAEKRSTPRSCAKRVFSLKLCSSRKQNVAFILLQRLYIIKKTFLVRKMKTKYKNLQVSLKKFWKNRFFFVFLHRHCKALISLYATQMNACNASHQSHQKIFSSRNRHTDFFL